MYIYICIILIFLFVAVAICCHLPAVADDSYDDSHEQDADWYSDHVIQLNAKHCEIPTRTHLETIEHHEHLTA